LGTEDVDNQNSGLVFGATLQNALDV